MELTLQEMEWAKQVIHKTELFTTCSDEELTQLINGLDKQHFKAGLTILFQGEISSRLCLVESGKVSINVRKGRDKLKVAELGAGTFFGEISLLTPRAATATVKAEDETTIVFLPGEIVQAMVKKNPALSEAINKKIEERLEANKSASENK